jgi:hypothetical protein
LDTNRNGLSTRAQPGREGPGNPPYALSVAGVYREVERELRRHDGIYQAGIEAMSHFGMLSQSGTVTRWADVRRDASREDWNMTPPSGSSVRIATRDGRYWRHASVAAATIA